MDLSPPYGVMLIDPPWPYSDPVGFVKNGEGQGGIARQYRSMSFEDLVAFGGNIREWADPEGCAVFIWETRTKTPMAIDLGRAWGLRHVAKVFTWVKVYPNVDLAQGVLLGDEYGVVDRGQRCGTGWHSKSTTESVRLWKIGNPGIFRDRGIRECIFTPVREHSRKPDEVRQRIEQAYPEAKRLEIFARCRPDGWDVYGDDLDRFEER